jgi:TolB-like protein
MSTLVLLLGTLFLSSPALAEEMTLAVLPLDKAAASEEYAGLGKALAGMLVTDLSAVPGIKLVERERLQALLDELELNSGDFVDPKSAQKLGKGVGARFVLAGSFSVVGEQFVLDARVVSVESGEIYKAADANGLITDIVSVEKDLVESLLTGLAVSLTSSLKRQLYSVAPTEDFGAFTAYGEGIEAQDAGNLEAARGAYERAVAADPDFAEARSALAGVKAAMAEYLADRNVKYNTAYRAMNLRVLEQTTDMREMKKDQLDMTAMSQFAVRLSALENEGMDCQRMAEMRAYLELVDFQVAEPERLPGKDAQGRSNGVLSFEVGKVAEDMSMVRYDHGAGGPMMAQQSPSRSAGNFRNIHRFLFANEWHDVLRFEPSTGYFGSASRCMEGTELVDEVDRMRADLKRAGLSDFSGHRSGAVTLDHEMQGLWLVWAARSLGASEELGRRSERFLSVVELSNPATASEEEKALERWGLGVLETVVREAKWRDQFNASLYGLSEQDMLTFLEGYERKDPAVVVMDDPACDYWFTSQHSSVRSNMKSYREEELEEDWFWMRTNMSRAATLYGPMRDMGCVVGEPARYEGIAEVMPMMRGAHDAYQRTPIPPDDTICESFGGSFGMTLDSYEQNLQYLSGTAHEPQVLAGVLLTYHQLNNMGCINPP